LIIKNIFYPVSKIQNIHYLKKIQFDILQFNTHNVRSNSDYWVNILIEFLTKKIKFLPKNLCGIHTSSYLFFASNKYITLPVNKYKNLNYWNQLSENKKIVKIIDCYKKIFIYSHTVEIYSYSLNVLHMNGLVYST